MDVLSLILTDDEEDWAFLHVMFNLLPKTRKKTREMILNRDSEGAFQILIKKYLLSEEDEFVKYFRVTPKIFYCVLEHISSELTTAPNNRVPNPISAEQMLCVTLRYMATGESHTSLSYSFRISRSWIGNIIKKVLCVLKIKLFFALPPPTKEQFESNGAQFGEKWNFPNVMGCLDGKHIRVQCPSRTGSLYYNYKDFFSIVLLALVGPNYKFIGVDIGSFGREGDAGDFKNKFMTQTPLLNRIYACIY